MKFVPGQYYRTRGGEKVQFIVDVRGFNTHNRQPLLFVVEGLAEFFSEDGNFWGDGEESQLDVVAEWKDPEVRTGRGATVLNTLELDPQRRYKITIEEI